MLILVPKRSFVVVAALVAVFGGLATDGAVAENQDVLTDVPIIRKSLDHALDTLPEGGTADWNNPGNGHSGTIAVGGSSRGADGQVCRSYQRKWTFDGGTTTFEGLACMSSSGLWRVQNERNTGRLVASPVPNAPSETVAAAPPASAVPAPVAPQPTPVASPPAAVSKPKPSGTEAAVPAAPKPAAAEPPVQTAAKSAAAHPVSSPPPVPAVSAPATASTPPKKTDPKMDQKPDQQVAFIPVPPGSREAPLGRLPTPSEIH